jgi:ABC-2 type transport system ATP-binding protein
MGIPKYNLFAGGYPMQSILSFEGTTKVLRSDLAGRHLYTLGPLDLEVMRGEIFGYLGPNGAGKTTTIKLMMGLLRPTCGRIVYFDGATVTAARGKLGFLPEQPYFYQHLTARELLGFYGRLFGLTGSVLGSRIDNMLRLIGLAEHADTRLSKFSKGMLQRIGLAQALINNPDIVILDEPLSGLDPVGRSELRDIILKLKAEGRTVFFSSHILQDVEMICDRVAILANGKILKMAAVPEVLYGSVTGYEIVASNAPANLIGKMSLGRLSVRGDKTVITMPPGIELNESLRRLMTLGVTIEAVNPLRQTLEDYFVSQLKGGGQTPATEPVPKHRMFAETSKENGL